MDMDRLELIARLQEQIAESRQELVRKTTEREANPIAMHDYLRAEIQQTPKEEVLLYKTTDNNALAATAVVELESSPFTAEQIDIIAQAFAFDQEREQAERERSFAPLREKIANLEGKVEILLGLLQNRLPEPRH